MGYWLELGVWGFRIDAVPFLIEYKGLDEEPDRDPLLLLSEMRDFLSWRRAGAIMLAEANIPREKAPDYFGGREFGADERMHLILDFPLNQALFLALARSQAAPIAQALASRPDDAPDQAQWATFLRNHDELSLDKLSDDERKEVFDAFGPDKDMQLYDRGLRRRLAPMLGDTDRVALAQSLLFALPGTPVMWYGDEIGQGEDLSLSERNAVRTPMQWADEPQGGFTRGKAEPVRPVVEDGPLGFHETSVAAQRGRPDSLLTRVQQLVRCRRACPEIGWGETQVIEGLPEAVLGLVSSWRGARVLTLHNLSDDEVTCAPDVEGASHLVALLGGPDQAAAEPLAPGDEIALPGYGYRWFRIDGERA
jgi:maltose alpha-D-glucosyltransferase/alpha-amylase